MPHQSVVYRVRAEFGDPETRTRYIEWLRDGHLQAIVRDGGALSGELTVFDDGPVETRYLFASRAAFEAYQEGAAVALRADAARLFPPSSGVRLSRALGERVARAPE